MSGPVSLRERLKQFQNLKQMAPAAAAAPPSRKEELDFLFAVKAGYASNFLECLLRF